MMLTWSEIVELIQEIDQQAAERFSCEAAIGDEHAEVCRWLANNLAEAQKNARFLAELCPPADDSRLIRAVIHKDRWIVEQFLPAGEPLDGYRISEWCCVLKRGKDKCGLAERVWLEQKSPKSGKLYKLPDDPPYVIEVGKDYVERANSALVEADRIRRRWYGVVIEIGKNIARIEDYSDDMAGAMQRADELRQAVASKTVRQVIAIG